MKFQFILIFLLLIKTCYSQYTRPTYTCNKKDNGRLYSLSPVAHDVNTPYVIEEFDLALEKGKPTTKGKLLFNFCNGLNVATEFNCPKDITSTGFFVWQEKTEKTEIKNGKKKLTEVNEYKCIRLSTSRDDKIYTKWYYKSLGDQGDHTHDGFIISGTNPETATDIFKYPIELKWKCNESLGKLNDAEFKKYKSLTHQNIETLALQMVIPGKYGCGEDLFETWTLLVKLGWPLKVIAISLGLMMVFFGFRMFKITLATLVLICTFVIVKAFFSLIWKDMNPKYQIWFVLGFSITISLIIGYFIFKAEKSAFVLSGFVSGGLLGLVLYSVLGIYKFENSDSNILLYLVMVVLGIGISTLGYYLHDHILLIGTGFGGSYMFIKAIGVWIGNYPNEFDLAEQLKNNKDYKIPTMFWIYILGMFVLAILGTIYQYKTKPIKEDDEGMEVIAKSIGRESDTYFSVDESI